MTLVEISYALDEKDMGVESHCFQSTLSKLLDLHGCLNLSNLKFALLHCGVGPGKSYLKIGGLDFSEGRVESVPLHAINIYSSVMRLKGVNSKSEFKFSESDSWIFFESLGDYGFASLRRNGKLHLNAKFDVQSLIVNSQAYLRSAICDVQNLFENEEFAVELSPVFEELGLEHDFSTSF